jgi:long-chain acyl-CoA synthetase
METRSLKRRAFHALLGISAMVKVWRQAGRAPGRLLYALGEYHRVRAAPGACQTSRVRIAYTAGGAIGPDLFCFYRSIGLNLKQLYGQTEAFHLTADGKIYSDTVGPAMTNVDLRIADNGEVLFKSPGMFTGYFKDAAKTAEVMTAEGFVKTGDAGFIDPKTGHLKIIDRAKDVGRLNDGSLFAPKYIENKLKFYPNIREAVVYGNGRDFVTAMLNIDLTAVGNRAERNNVVYGSYQELAGLPQVYDMLARHVEGGEPLHGRGEARWPARRSSALFDCTRSSTLDDGEVTRTQGPPRLRRRRRYAPLIDALYNGASEADISTEVTFEDGARARSPPASRSAMSRLRQCPQSEGRMTGP